MIRSNQNANTDNKKSDKIDLKASKNIIHNIKKPTSSASVPTRENEYRRNIGNTMEILEKLRVFQPQITSATSISNVKKKHSPCSKLQKAFAYKVRSSTLCKSTKSCET